MTDWYKDRPQWQKDLFNGKTHDQDVVSQSRVELGDKIGMYNLDFGVWNLVDTGVVKYVGPGYVVAEFWKNRTVNGEVRLPLTRQKGVVSHRFRFKGFKFVKYSEGLNHLKL